jgi:hypothetical protein
VGSPKDVASDITGRFDGRVDRVGFYTPSLIGDETLGELMDAVTPGRAVPAPLG